MVTVPAFVWRGGFFRRALLLGAGVGFPLAALGWIDSGMLLSAIIVLVVTGLIYGIWLARRMSRYWPGAKQLSGEDRVTVVRAARSGERVGDPRLAQAVIDYSEGLRAAEEQARPFRWVVPLVLIVGVATTVYDAVFGSWGNVIASVIYFVAFLVELLWWPKVRNQVLANADRAANIARLTLSK
jgi:protein-S-isoprenylcysteine O-methyltransferase Ste14